MLTQDGRCCDCISLLHFSFSIARNQSSFLFWTSVLSFKSSVKITKWNGYVVWKKERLKQNGYHFMFVCLHRMSSITKVYWHSQSALSLLIKLSPTPYLVSMHVQYNAFQSNKYPFSHLWWWYHFNRSTSNFSAALTFSFYYYHASVVIIFIKVIAIIITTIII